MGPSDCKCPPKCYSQKLHFSLLGSIDQGLANNGLQARFGLLFSYGPKMKNGFYVLKWLGGRKKEEEYFVIHRN